MTLGVRRISILSLCFVVLMTTVGFACLLFAATAFGMPADHGMSACGMPIESAVACPHDDGGEVATAGSIEPGPQQAAVVALPPAPLPPTGMTDLPVPWSGDVPEPPLSHLTPLRI